MNLHKLSLLIIIITLLSNNNIFKAAGFNLDNDRSYNLSLNQMELDIKNSKSTSLHTAAKLGNTYMVRLMLLLGDNISVKVKDGNNKTALDLACQYGHKEIVELLVNHHKKYEGSISGLNNGTSLHEAVISNNIKEVEKLLCQGFNPNAIDLTFITPLHEAVFKGNIYIVELLLRHGANVNAQDVSGDTPLHRAILGNYLKIAVLLFLKGAQVDIENKYNITPLDVSLRFNGVKITKLLLYLNELIKEHPKLWYQFVRFYNHFIESVNMENIKLFSNMVKPNSINHENVLASAFFDMIESAIKNRGKEIKISPCLIRIITLNREKHLDISSYVVKVLNYNLKILENLCFKVETQLNDLLYKDKDLFYSCVIL